MRVSTSHTVERAAGASCELVNDVHSRMNATVVRRVERPASLEAVQDALGIAWGSGRAVSVAGGRHSMGGQQFGTDTVLIDMRGMDRVLHLDRARGTVTVQAGIAWPALIEHLLHVQAGADTQWGIVQKQTGADNLTIGGALASNIHGRGLGLPPFVDQVEAFDLIDANGSFRRCRRDENRELFALAAGGYGLFGLVTSVTLRLAPRCKVQRWVEERDVDDVIDVFEARRRDGCLFGDFQFAIDASDETFLRRGIMSCYRPVAMDTPIHPHQRTLSGEDWARLIYLAHHDKRRAFEMYSTHYRATHGQVYWSDTHQLAQYVDDYHVTLDRTIGAAQKGTEMISELYVPRHALTRFLDAARTDLRQRAVDVIYGTIRLIERDTDTFLPWAREPWACIVFNVHVVHTADGRARGAEAFRSLIDLVILHGGSYYLTYHRWASAAQVERCYPRFRRFLDLKRQYDPAERFQSDWYRHYRALMG